MSAVGIVGGTLITIVGIGVLGSVATAYILYAGITGVVNSVRNVYVLPNGKVLERET